jgi:hypothetical protein
VLIKQLNCPSKYRSFYYSCTVIRTSENDSLKNRDEGFKNEGFLETKFLRKKTPEPALLTNKDPSVYNFRPSEGSRASTRNVWSNTSKGIILSAGASAGNTSTIFF